MGKRSLYVLLWVTFLASLGLMVGDFYFSHEPNLMFFYLITNAVLLYRLFGVWWLTIVLHSLIHIGVLVVFLMANMDHLVTFYNMVIWVPLALQCLIALHLVVFRRGRSPDEQACHSGIHAHIGLIVITMLFWNIGFSRKRCLFCGLFTCFYMLLFLCIVLTPHFHGLSKAIMKLTRKGRRSKRGSRQSVTSTESMRKVKFGAGHRQKR